MRVTQLRCNIGIASTALLAENEGQEPRSSPPDKDTEPKEEESLHPVDRRSRRKSRIVIREAELTDAEDHEQAASQLRPLLTSSS